MEAGAVLVIPFVYQKWVQAEMAEQVQKAVMVDTGVEAQEALPMEFTDREQRLPQPAIALVSELAEQVEVRRVMLVQPVQVL